MERAERLVLAHETMLAGMLVNRAVLPQVVLRTGGFDEMNDVAIDLWMGASPNYTHRMRALMGIEGDKRHGIGDESSGSNPADPPAAAHTGRPAPALSLDDQDRSRERPGRSGEAHTAGRRPPAGARAPCSSR
jgi:hypothetical protein